MRLPQTVNSAVLGNTKFERNFLGVTAVARSRGLSSLISRWSAAVQHVGTYGKAEFLLLPSCLFISFFFFFFFWGTGATRFLQLSQSSSSIFIDGNLLGDFLILSPELTTHYALCQVRRACKQLISDCCFIFAQKSFFV